MDRSQDHEESQDATQEDSTQDDTAQDRPTQDDPTSEESNQDGGGSSGAGQGENGHPLDALQPDPMSSPLRRLNIIQDDLADLGNATGEMARMMRHGDSDGIPALLAMTHLAVRGLKQDVKDVREHIRRVSS
jgi:hypothetical protein